MSSFQLNQKNLTLKIFQEICFNKQKVSIHSLAKKKMTQSENLLKKWLKQGKTIYGLNTGFGVLSDKKIPNSKTKELQLNLIRSHSCGVGPHFNEVETRGIMLLRAHVLVQGYSGVRIALVQIILDCLNKGVLPVIPVKGSVGASGDLAPLSHLALTLVGEGEAYLNNVKMSSKAALKKAGIKPILLEGREGIALINGTQVMATIGALNVIRAKKLLKLFDTAASLSLEACFGSRHPYESIVHDLRPHTGQKQVAKNIWALTANSTIQKTHKDCSRVQDAYSFRCVPQVHGSVRDTVAYVEKIITTELNSVTDNPLFFTKENKSISGGNFHGQYLAHAMDYLAISMTTLSAISERRIEKLFDPHFSGLPTCLAPNPGLDSGLMLAHVTAAAVTSENKVLSHPASVDTIPTSSNKEDHVSMGTHAAVKAKEVLKNARTVLAVELLSASQGIEYRRPLKTSAHLEKVMKVIRKKIPKITKDRQFGLDIKKMKTLFNEISDQVSGLIQ